MVTNRKIYKVCFYGFFMKINNLLGKIATGATTIVALSLGAGTSYAGAKEDLETIRNHIKANPTLKTMGGEPYGIRDGNLLMLTKPGYTVFEIDGKNFYAFCDLGNDGEIDRIVSLPGNSRKADKREGRMDCLSADSLEMELSMNDMVGSKRIVRDARGDVYDFEKNAIYPSDRNFMQKMYERVLKGALKRIGK